MAGRERHTDYALVYAALLPGIRKIAREHGYAIAVHGSMATDLDLLACPWTEEAGDAHALVEAIRKHLGLLFCECEAGQPEQKPQGRLAWSMQFDPKSDFYIAGPYIDISVMPRRGRAQRRANPGRKRPACDIKPGEPG